jgi:hypothetical protein
LSLFLPLNKNKNQESFIGGMPSKSALRNTYQGAVTSAGIDIESTTTKEFKPN